ncbi:putative proline-rich receptor-like protein kinase PERK13 [Iris pallida]|uniref:Proline-rich receptor-like protein kinase PERK13 n=1 Tax=Iris pallida TaxID=29817 RepID=A0AAX6I4H4_IRIPA|nr:putative proline-rich receptor-like protein kinase PERK13 [Iris pallida]
MNSSLINAADHHTTFLLHRSPTSETLTTSTPPYSDKLTPSASSISPTPTVDHPRLPTSPPLHQILTNTTKTTDRLHSPRVSVGSVYPPSSLSSDTVVGPDPGDRAHPEPSSTSSRRIAPSFAADPSFGQRRHD